MQDRERGGHVGRTTVGGARGGRDGARDDEQRGNEDEQAGTRDQRLARGLERRQLRLRLMTKVTREVEETTLLALAILHGMELGDDEAELSPPLAEQIGQRVCDRITDQLFHGITVAFRLGELGGEAVFGATKGVLEHEAEKRSKIGAVEIKKGLRRSILEASAKYREEARTLVAAIPSEKIGEIARILGGFEAFAGDDGDSDENGNLQAGMEEQFLEKLGFPQTGPARAHDIAVESYLVLRAELRAARPVAQQAGELQRIQELPLEAESKARASEEDMGEATVRGMARDQNQRRRTEALTAKT